MIIPDKTAFQPSGAALKKWLATRKSTIHINGVPLQGFFNDTGNSTDTSWFYVAMAAELLGLTTLITGGAINGIAFLVGAVAVVVVSVFCDMLLAIGLHRHVGERCLIQSRLLLLNDNDKQKIHDLTLQLQKGKFMDFILKTAIVLISMAKVGAIVVLGVFEMPGFYVLFVVIYAAVAYVHLYHTGYYLAYINTQKAIRKDHLKFAKGHFLARQARQRVTTISALHDLPIRHSPHEILEESKDNHDYAINTIGVLTDNDIIGLINGQSDSNKLQLFKVCRRLQLDNIEAAASI